MGQKMLIGSKSEAPDQSRKMGKQKPIRSPKDISATLLIGPQISTLDRLDPSTVYFDIYALTLSPPEID